LSWSTRLSRLRFRGRALLRFDHGWRRFHCEEQSSPVWLARAEDAVSLWNAHESRLLPRGNDPLIVADIGAGDEKLRRILNRQPHRPVRYYAFDLYPQRRTTKRLDVTRGLPGQFDVCFCLGLLEYLPPEVPCLDHLRTACDFVVVSFAFADGSPPLARSERTQLGWVRHDSRASFEARFVAHGFKKEAFRLTVAGEQGLWLWSAAV
jgi:hypothetical protein